jgi:hypothetical protein
VQSQTPTNHCFKKFFKLRQLFFIHSLAAKLANNFIQKYCNDHFPFNDYSLPTLKQFCSQNFLATGLTNLF